MLIAVPIGAIQRHVCRVAWALLSLLWLGTPSDAFAQVVQFNYSATDEWAESQIMLFPGDRVALDTRANWCNVGPPDAMFNQFGLSDVQIGGTYLPNAPLGMALARIGDAIWPAIDRSIVVSSPGRLQFAMNDVPGNYRDNRGDATVTIRMTLTQVVMPTFTGRTIAEAEKFFAALGLKPDVQRGQSDLDLDLIYDQQPQGGTDLHRVQPLVLYVSAREAPIAVPDVVGQPVSTATRIVRAAGLSPVSAGTEGSALAAWSVTRTEPVAQTLVQRGTTVHLWLASGENVAPDDVDQPLDVSAPPAVDMIPVPDAVGQSESDAVKQLQSKRLIGRKIRAEFSVLARGFVTRTDPAAGKPVKSGSRVWYWLASGKNIVPDVSEMSLSRAVETLAESGFHNVVDVSEFSSGARGTVSSQSAAANLPAELDTRIVLTVRKAMWPFLVVGILGLAVAGGGAFRFRRWRQRIRTQRHVRVSSRLDANTESALPDEIPAYNVEIKVTLVAGKTEFSHQPEISSSEVRNA